MVSSSLEFLKSQAGNLQTRQFWIGIKQDKFIDGTPFNKQTDYNNFDASFSGRGDCVAMQLPTGKWVPGGCGSTRSGAVCEIYPERAPQRPLVSVSGTTISNGEMLVSDGDKITLRCRAKVGTQGRLTFVKKFTSQAWPIDEHPHIGIIRSKGPKMIGGTCFEMSDAVLVFHVLKDMEGMTVGCISHKIKNFMCSHRDPYCATLPGTFKFRTGGTQTGQRIQRLLS
ncbi:hypothetical protein ElyMa_006873900 [Elysia marginata]|uniref:C-type lectin domain-containing protein n=1 Tax=Elysia marginata TaxID=1093978 RepID=A0AAV4JAY5_9GAST|nr:hypothetical protein ElyMa_006873900 [Elysia marginata]